MASSWTCLDCNKEVTETKGNHRRRVHQEEVTKSVNGVQYSAKRTKVDGEELGTFSCLKVGCEFKTPWPTSWQNHLISCGHDLLPLENGVAGDQHQDPNQEEAQEMEIEEDLEEEQPDLHYPLVFKGDESDLVVDDRLAQCSLSLNKAFGMLLCHHADCGFALEGNWWNHTNAHRKRQKLQPLTQEDKDAVKEILDANRGFHFVPTADMVPVQGLLLHKGHVCLTCETEEPHCSTGLDALRRHNYKEHNGHPFRHEPGFYQTLAKTGAAHFRVNTSTLLSNCTTLNLPWLCGLLSLRFTHQHLTMTPRNRSRW